MQLPILIQGGMGAGVSDWRLARAVSLEGRKCICNALLANVGLGQLRGRTPEPGIVTSGDQLPSVAHFFKPGTTRYSAADVISRIVGPGSHAFT